MRALGALALVLALIAAAPAAAAAAVPYAKNWKRAAGKARFAAVPAPGSLAGLRPQRSAGARAIDGQYTAGQPDEPECRAVTDRLVFRQATATFARAADGTRMFISFLGRTPKPCEPPRPRDLRGTERLGRVKVLGERLRLDRFPLATDEVGYRVQGRLRGHLLNLQLNYASTDPGKAEIVRIARSLRWVRRR